MGILSDEEPSKVISITYIGQSFQVFAYIWPIILFLSSHLGPSPRCMCGFFLKWILPQAYGCMSSLVMEWGRLPFQPPRSLPAHVHTGKSSLTSRTGTLLLYFGRAQLLPLAFPWSVWVRTKLEFHSTRQTLGVQPRGHCLLPQFQPGGLKTTSTFSEDWLTSFRFTLLP